MTKQQKTKDFLELHNSVSKTEEQLNKLQETESLDKQIHENLYEQYLQDVYETQEVITDSLKEFKNTVNDINKIYQDFLGKYNLKQLIQTSIACLNKKVPWIDVQSQICKNAIRLFLQDIEIDNIQGILVDLKNGATTIENFVNIFSSNKSNNKQSIDKVDKFLKDLEDIIDISELCDVLSLNIKDFNKFIDSVTNLVNFDIDFNIDIPEFKQFEFLDNIPTIDFISSVREQTEKQIEEQVLTFVISSIAILLEQVIDNECLSDDRDISSNEFPTNQQLSNLIREKYGSFANDLSELFKSSSKILSASELCGLLRGQGNQEIYSIINFLIEKKFPSLISVLKDEENILDFFVLLSNAVDLGICEEIVVSGGNFGFCFEDKVERIRECALSKEDIELSEINALLNEIEKNHKDKLEKLFNLLVNNQTEQIDFSNLCKINEDSQLLIDISNSFEQNTLRVIDAVLETVGISYDQALSSYIQKIIKEVDIPREEYQETLPSFYNKVLENATQTYNQLYSQGLSSFANEKNELENIINNSLDGDKTLNELVSYQKTQEISKVINSLQNKKRKVLPELKSLLESGEFIDDKDTNVSFVLPEGSEKEINKIFQDKITSATLPKNKENRVIFSNIGKVNNNNELFDKTSLVYYSKEERIRRSSFQTQELNCQEYKVYLPICFGLAIEEKLYDTSVLNSQPLFPDFSSIYEEYYPEFNPMTSNILGLFGNSFSHLSKMAQQVYNNVENQLKTRLLNRDGDRFLPHVLNNLSKRKIHSAPNITTKFSDYELYRYFYNPLGIRGNLTEENKKTFLFFLERQWFENVWSNLLVAYHYRVYKNGEAYLTKIDLGDKSLSDIENDALYGGPKTNIEDYISYNSLDLGQNRWSKSQWNEIVIGPTRIQYNPLRYFAGFNQKVLSFDYGIPANQKAREFSWKENNKRRVDSFEGNILPSYLGEQVSENAIYQDKELAIKKQSKNIKFINNKNSLLGKFNVDSLLPISFSPRTGNALINLSSVPSFKDVEKQHRIMNILDVGNNPFLTFQKQGKKRFPELSIQNQKGEYSQITNHELFQEQKRKKQYSSKYFSGFKQKKEEVEKKSEWDISSVSDLNGKQKANIEDVGSKNNVYSYVWSNIIIDSLEKRYKLSEEEKTNIRQFYQNIGYKDNIKDFISRFSRYISLSPLFQSVEITNNKPKDFSISNETKKEGLLEANILELINLNPKPFQKNLICDIDLDLLRTSEIKRQVAKKHKELIRCLPDNENINFAANTSIKISLVKILIRLYAIEYVLNSSFFFSKFDLSILEIENFISQRIALQFKEDVKEEGNRRNNPQYLLQILEVVGALYLDELSLNDENINCDFALDYLIKKQISLVSSRLKDILYTNESQSNQYFSIEDVYFNNLIPFVSLPSRDVTYKQGRFVPTNKDNMTDLQIEDYLRYFTGLKEIEERNKKYDLNFMGFYLERYVIPKWKEKHKPKEKVLNGLVGLEQFNSYLESRIENSQDRLTKYLDKIEIGMRLVYRPKPNSREHEFLKSIINKRTKEVNYETKDYYEPGQNITKSNFFLVKQTINGNYIQEGREGVRKKSSVRLELYWKVDTKRETNALRMSLRGNKWDFSKLTNKNERNSKIYIFVDNKGQSFESFIQNKNIKDVLDFIENFMYNDTDNPGTLSSFRYGSVSAPMEPPKQFQEKSLVGESILLPLIDIKKETSVVTIIEDISETITKEKIFSEQKNDESCKNIIIQKETRKENTIILKFAEEYEKCYEKQFKQRILESELYDLMFNDVFSIKKYFNLLSYYVSLYVNKVANTDGLFDIVRNNLFSFIEQLNSIENKSFSGNLNNNLSYVYPENIIDRDKNYRLFDIDVIRNSTPYVIMKGLMETFDPNIAPSKKITDIANNYKKQILQQARPFLNLEEKVNKTTNEITELEASRWLIELAKELEETPDLPVHIPSIFFMISGIVPTPLGFAYLGFESILGTDLLETIEENTMLKRKIEEETGVSLDAARKLANTLNQVCGE